MKKRIKYSIVDGTFISESILCNDMILHIRIGKAEEKFIYMIATNVQHAVYLGNAKSLTNAKRLAKAKLVEFGALFGDEVRGKEVI